MLMDCDRKMHLMCTRQIAQVVHESASQTRLKDEVSILHFASLPECLLMPWVL